MRRNLIICLLLAGLLPAGLVAQKGKLAETRTYDTAFLGASEGAIPSFTPLQETGCRLMRVHKISGYGALLLGGVAAFSSGSKSLHYAAAYTATGLGVLACVTGFKIYGPHIQLNAGLFNQANRHWMLGTLGAALCAAAVISADNGNLGGHSGLGVGGGVLMTVSVLNLKISF